MLATLTDVLDVPVSLDTILQIRETNSYQRTLFFQNLTASALAAQIEESGDGGGTWTLIDTSFAIGIAGSGSDVVIKNISSTNILRVRASGGGNDRDMYVGFSRMYLDANHIWSSPLV